MISKLYSSHNYKSKHLLQTLIEQQKKSPVMHLHKIIHNYHVHNLFYIIYSRNNNLLNFRYLQVLGINEHFKRKSYRSHEKHYNYP